MAATDIRICGRNNSWRGGEYPPLLWAVGAHWILDDVENLVAWNKWKWWRWQATDATWTPETLGSGLLPVPCPLPVNFTFSFTAFAFMPLAFNYNEKPFILMIPKIKPTCNASSTDIKVKRHLFLYFWLKYRSICQ